VIDRLSAFWRQWLHMEIRVESKCLYVARYVEPVFDAPGTAVERVIAAYLRTHRGRLVCPKDIDALAFEDRKAALAAIAARHAQVQGVAILPKRALRTFLATIRAAHNDCALEELARRFIVRHEELSRAMLADVRAGASSLIA
jgi:hypothetical protein